MYFGVVNIWSPWICPSGEHLYPIHEISRDLMHLFSSTLGPPASGIVPWSGAELADVI